MTTAQQTYTAIVSNLSSCNFFCCAIAIHTVLVQKVSTNCDVSNRGSTSSLPHLFQVLLTFNQKLKINSEFADSVSCF